MGYNDVFADVVNVLLFNGEEVVNPDDLVDATTFSYYKCSGSVRSQERDVAKFWQNGEIRIAFIELENQSVSDSAMPARMLSYDGVAYRDQLTSDNKTQLFPVISLVLYFGLEKWDKPTSLLENMNVPDRLKPFVKDYDFNLFQIAFLDDETVAKFKSDFRIVAEYFTQSRKYGHEFKFTDGLKAVHIMELLNALTVFSGDNRFEKVNLTPNETKGGVAMNSILDKVEERGRIKGEAQGIEIGIDKVLRLKTILKQKGDEDLFLKALDDKNILEALMKTYNL